MQLELECGDPPAISETSNVAMLRNSERVWDTAGEKGGERRCARLGPRTPPPLTPCLLFSPFLLHVDDGLSQWLTTPQGGGSQVFVGLETTAQSSSLGAPTCSHESPSSEIPHAYPKPTENAPPKPNTGLDGRRAVSAALHPVKIDRLI